MIAILYEAGGLPVQLRTLKGALYRKAQEILLIDWTKNDIGLKNFRFQKPDFMLSGCGMFNYSRGAILTVFGTLLTYSVILCNTKEWGKGVAKL